MHVAVLNLVSFIGKFAYPAEVGGRHCPSTAFPIVTSAKEVMFLPVFVCLSSVC